MIRQRIIVLFCSVLFSLAGCQTPQLYNQTDDNIAEVAQRSKDALAKIESAGKVPPPLVVNSGLYIDKTPINLEKEPSWLKSKIILKGGMLPFSYYSRTIASGSENLLLHYAPEVDTSMKLSMDYSGTVKNALDLLATKTGYVYTIKGRNIYWQAFLTKTFDVAFLPGVAEYSLGDISGGDSTTGASSGGTTTTGGVSAGNQASTLKATISLWKDLQDTVKTMLSPSGTIIVSEATTSVTVRDRPANVALVSKYIENLNNTLVKQVLIKVEVLEVTLNSAFNYGIDWGIVQNAFGGSNFVLNANYGTPISIQSLATGSSGFPYPMGGIQRDPTHTTGITMLINALKQQGKTAVVTEPRVVCVNNQVSVIQLVDRTGYAASVSSTALAGNGAGGSSITSSITPGTLVTGLVLYLLPKIMGNKIFLQVNASLSSKISIDDFTSGKDGPSPATIEVPHTTDKQFNQRSVIGSGDTLILSGFRRVANQNAATQFLDSQSMGGKGSQQENSETIVLITPILLNGSA